MPIFEYICLDCEQRFETLVLSSSEEVCCPDCESKRLEKLVSTFATGGGQGTGLGSTCSSSGGFS